MEYCFSKEVEDCKSPCVLEYQADTEEGNPTCVPPVSSLAQTLSANDVEIVKRVLSRLLPSPTSSALSNAFESLHRPLWNYVNLKIKNEIEGLRHTSWAESSKRIAAATMNEILDLDCFACCKNLNEVDSVVHTMSCCGNIGHRECIRQGRTFSPNCAWCRAYITSSDLVPRSSPPREDFPNQYDYLFLVIISFLMICSFSTAFADTRVGQDARLIVDGGEDLFSRIREALWGI